MPRRQITWASIALVLLGASAWLTFTVTQVEGTAPFALYSDDGATLQKSRLSDAQVFAVLFKTPTDTSGAAPAAPPPPTPAPAAAAAIQPNAFASVAYGTRHFGDADAAGTKKAPIFSFFMPPNDGVVLALNNIAPVKRGFQCKTDGPPPAEAINVRSSNKVTSIARAHSQAGNARPRYVAFNVAKPERFGRVAINRLTLPASTKPFVLYCRVMPHYTRLTFTRRQEDFLFLEPGHAHTITAALSAGLLDVPASAFPGYAPPASIAMDVNIQGADQLSFTGGRRDDTLADPDSTRLLLAGDSVTANWTDLSREQLRDVLLVIIGTLIAIGVTSLVEAVRPFVDGEKLAAELELIREYDIPDKDEAPAKDEAGES
ncbi:MAG TPA: hypothetical protein VGL66_03035 [Caulobacteraceae bacterium]|jgi:hypothetical protein